MLNFAAYSLIKLNFADIDQVLSIEEEVYSHPWTRGNFSDSLMNGYDAFALLDQDRCIQAYFWVMPVLDELHLLNFAVSAEKQGKGLGKVMLTHLFDYAHEQGFASILLEVRAGNQRAIEVYLKGGFEEIGRRKGYYPALGDQREDAIVMRRIC